jgi:hypothetical protein
MYFNTSILQIKKNSEPLTTKNTTTAVTYIDLSTGGAETVGLAGDALLILLLVSSL